MTHPAILIMDEIDTRLKLIKKTNGYSNDVASVERASLKPFMDDDLPAINYWPGEDQALAKGHGWVDRQISIVVEYYSRTRDRPFSDVSFELAEDVAISMLRSVTFPRVSDDPDLTLGGLVRSVQLSGVVPQLSEGQAPWCGVALTYELIYRVSASNPTVLIS